MDRTSGELSVYIRYLIHFIRQYRIFFLLFAEKRTIKKLKIGQATCSGWLGSLYPRIVLNTSVSTGGSEQSGFYLQLEKLCSKAEDNKQNVPLFHDLVYQ